MKNIKDLKCKSVEGLEVRNVKTFPSMEWGEDGGLEADIYYQGKFAVRVFQEGNGGCALDTERDDAVLTAAKPAILAMLKRLDKGYETYSWLKSKTVDKLDADDYEAVANIFLEQHDLVKNAQKSFKRGCKSFIAVIKDAMIHTFNSAFEFEPQALEMLIRSGKYANVPTVFDRLVLSTAENVNQAF